MYAVSISGTCGQFFRLCMGLYMFAYIVRISVLKCERVGCDSALLWIFLWYFSGFLLDFYLLWNDLIVCLIAYCFYNKKKSVLCTGRGDLCRRQVTRNNRLQKVRVWKQWKHYNFNDRLDDCRWEFLGTSSTLWRGNGGWLDWKGCDKKWVDSWASMSYAVIPLGDRFNTVESGGRTQRRLRMMWKEKYIMDGSRGYVSWEGDTTGMLW